MLAPLSTVIRKVAKHAILLSPFLLVACGSDKLTGPSSVSVSPATGAVFMSVSPQGSTSGVPASTPITFRFGGPMASGMEQYFDMHLGGLDGPVVPMNCGWTADRAVLTCNPAAPLTPRMTYTIHMGGGLRDAQGNPAGYDTHGAMMGGQWIQGGMMSGLHGGGMGWGMMGDGWRHANGSYGMAFSFTTA
jgi:hypothetical protein